MATRTNSNDPSQHHPLYDLHAGQVSIVDNIYNGTDAAKQYLFQFPQELETTFNTRKDRATLRNFVKRAVEAFVGMIFRKSIEIDGYGARTTRSFDKIDTRQNVQEFTKELTTSVTKHGKAYILVDSPSEATGEFADQPYFVLVERPSLINWRRDSEGHFTMIVIEEVISEPVGDFGMKYVKQYRHYAQDGTITIYRRSSTTLKNSDISNMTNSAGYYIHAQYETDYDGIPLIEIDIGDVPMLYDIALMNIKHFNRQSHKDRYLTMAALPIPVIWGADLDDDGNASSAKPALVIGVDEAFIFTGTKQESDFEWRELSGTSIELLESDLNAIIEDITTGILRAAETANSVQKTATEVALLQAEASNRTSSIAIAVNTAMKEALEILAQFNNEGVPATAVFKMSTDFNAALAGNDGQRLIFEAYMAGTISVTTYLNSLSDAELISIESADKEVKRIQADQFKPEAKVEVPSLNQDKRTMSQTDPKEDDKPKEKNDDKK